MKKKENIVTKYKIIIYQSMNDPRANMHGLQNLGSILHGLLNPWLVWHGLLDLGSVGGDLRTPMDQQIGDHLACS
jgi:hypothetical protein